MHRARLDLDSLDVLLCPRGPPVLERRLYESQRDMQLEFQFRG